MLSVVLSCLIGSLLTFLLYSGFDIGRLHADHSLHGHAQCTRHPSLDIDDNTPPFNFDCSQRHDSPRKRTHDADEGLPHLFSHIPTSGLDSKSNRPSDDPRRQTMQLHGNTDHQTLIPQISLLPTLPEFCSALVLCTSYLQSKRT